MSKRIFDMALAFVGLVLTAPLLALIALLVRLDSRGPVFFKQERVGKDGRPFRILKFRTMVQGAAALGPRLTRKRDPRITRVGQALRWLKLDELPQLLNVLRGEMSFVGPRPEDPHFVGFYTSAQRAVLSVRPGIVGPSQIAGRDELERYPEGVDTERYYIDHILPEKLATDLAYVRAAGLLHDMGLIAAGVWATVAGAFKAKFLRLHRPRLALLAIDTFAAMVVYHLAWALKLESASWPDGLFTVSVLMVVVRVPVFLAGGLYQQLLRYLGTDDFLAVTKAVTIGSVLIAAATPALGLHHSWLVTVVDWGLLILVLFGVRVAGKLWLASAGRPSLAGAKRVLLVGADDTGEQLVSAMVRDGGARYRAVGFLDDDPAKHGLTIHGMRVLGRVSDLAAVLAVEAVDMVVILFPLVSAPSLRELLAYCRDHGLEYRLVPTLERLLDGDLLMPDFEEPTRHETAPAGAAAKTNGGPPHAATPDGDAAASAAAKTNGGTLHAAPADGDGRRAPAVVTAPVTGGRDTKRVLVTGGAGYVGSHVVRKLLARGTPVRVVDSYLYGSHGLQAVLGHPLLEVIEGDIRHLGTMAAATKSVSKVIALAALVGDAACELDPEETLSTNLEATRLLAHVCERAGVERLVFASSCSVYGANSSLILNEGSWLNPVSLYARTRIQSEEELLRRGERLSVAILRLATVFGLSPRMRLDLLVNTFTAHACTEKRVRVFGGSQWRPNLHCQDAAAAFIAAADADDAKVRGEIFNVGNNALNYTVLDVAKRVHAQLPWTEVALLDGQTDERDYRVSFDKIQHVLGFQTKHTLEDGIREIAAAFSAGLLDPADERYHNFRHLKAHGFSAAFRRAHLLGA